MTTTRRKRTKEVEKGGGEVRGEEDIEEKQ